MLKRRAFGYVKLSPYADLFDAIVHERRVKLGLEGKRYFDLVRWVLQSSISEARGIVPLRRIKASRQ
jgi:hypothetical protein